MAKKIGVALYDDESLFLLGYNEESKFVHVYNFSDTFEGSFEVVEENYGKVSLIVTDNTNGIRYKARTTTAKLIDFMFVGEGIQGHTYTGTIRVVSNGDNGLIVPPKKKA